MFANMGRFGFYLVNASQPVSQQTAWNRPLTQQPNRQPTNQQANKPISKTKQQTANRMRG